ncbi:L-dopachrome tautomerase yellow-f2, partial [Pseudolycoriella hygida]
RNSFCCKYYDYFADGDGIAFPDESNHLNEERESALSSNFVPYNNVPMGVTHVKGKLIMTIPRRNPGIPATLNFISTKSPKRSSPSFRAFPNYRTNALHPQNLPDSSRIVSVYRTRLDACNRLWFIDTGTLEYNGTIQVQRPSIWVIDMNTEETIRRFEIPASIVQPGHGMASVTVDVDENNCDGAFAYIPDLLVYRLHVYSFAQDRMWSFTHNYFNFDPMHGDFNVVGLQYQWNDGIFSISLGKRNPDGYRPVYFHPMVSISEFVVNSRVLQSEAASQRSNHMRDFLKIGERGRNTQSAMHDLDLNSGIMFYSQVAVNGVSCWNTAKPYTPRNHALLERNDETMIYPGDLNVDRNGTLWVMTNSMVRFIYSQLDPNVYNFRVWKANVRDIVRGTICGP